MGIAWGKQLLGKPLGLQLAAKMGESSSHQELRHFRLINQNAARMLSLTAYFIAGWLKFHYRKQ